jgi:hypothetical protein
MCGGPLRYYFQGEDVWTTVAIIIPVDSDAMRTMLEFSYGTAVRVKCRLGFRRKESRVSLIAEDMEEIETVKVILN